MAALKSRGIACHVGSRNAVLNQEYEHPFRLEQMTSADDWRETVARYDVILNCVGILRPTGAASYQHIHHLAPAALAQACENSDTRFIQVSALGLAHPHRSGFLTSKRQGETAIQATSADWIIVRPSLLDGEGGFGASWLRVVARLPVFLSPMDAVGKIAALTATDLGSALAVLCLHDSEALGLAESRVFELGGEHTYTFESYIRALRTRSTTHRALALPLPGIIARLGAHFCDGLKFSPFSFGHWELLRKDNVPSPNRLTQLLGRPPEKVTD